MAVAEENPPAPDMRAALNVPSERLFEPSGHVS